MKESFWRVVDAVAVATYILMTAIFGVAVTSNSVRNIGIGRKSTLCVDLPTLRRSLKSKIQCENLQDLADGNYVSH